MLDSPGRTFERPEIELLLPVAHASIDASSLAARVASLDDAVIGLVSNSWVSLDIVYEEVRAALLARSSRTRFVDAAQLKSRKLEPAIEDDLATRCSAVINGLGNCGGCTTLTTLASVDLERRGIPTVTLVTETFRDLALLAADAAGLPNVRLIVLPFPFETLPRDEILKWAGKTIPLIVGALTEPEFPSLSVVR